MKKIIICISMMLALGLVSNAQSIQRQGNTFTQVTNRSHKADTLVTQFKFKDSQNKEYSIIINKSTGACYVWRTSRNGKLYKSYMKAEISQQICSELNVEYKPRTRTRNH